MIAALKSNDLDYVDSVPQTVATTLGKSGDIQVIPGPGIEVRDFGFNSSPKKKKNRELLDPQAARRALARVRSQADDRRRLARARAAARDARDAALEPVHEHQAAA